MTDACTDFLACAAPPHRQQAETWLQVPAGVPAWAAHQRAFLDMVGHFAAAEMAQPATHLVQTHEAGGNWRIVFPHLRVRPYPRGDARLASVLTARQAFTAAHYHGGFPDECEVHHDVETFLYFQIPLVHAGTTARAEALRSIAVVADHCGNWTPGVPPWYDWQAHGFRSTWLGTRRVRAEPPYDYQEANHFRFIVLVLTAWLGTGSRRYLDLAEDYVARWCAHIEAHAGRGAIPCQILPVGAVTEELGKAGANTRTDVYQVFYAAMAANTAYDIVQVLLDLHRLTGQARCLRAAQALIDPFFEHAIEGRPACAFSGGRWVHADTGRHAEPARGITQWYAFVCRMALKHDHATGAGRYRQPLLAWARAIDEESVSADQAACDVMAAAHELTGDSAWLRRGYAMALRTWAVCESNLGRADGEGTNCNVATRYGSKFIMELLYAPLLGGCDWGTRGGIPDWRWQHEGDAGGGLPDGVALRLWPTAAGWSYEALNGAAREVSWFLRACSAAAPPVPAANRQRLKLAPGGSARGVL